MDYFGNNELYIFGKGTGTIEYWINNGRYLWEELQYDSQHKFEECKQIYKKLKDIDYENKLKLIIETYVMGFYNYDCIGKARKLLEEE